MKYKKKIVVICYLVSFTILNNCVQSTVGLLGPAITGIKTGNIYQSSFSYVSSNVIKKKIGETPAVYVKNLLIQSPKIKKINFTTNKEKIENLKLSSVSESSDINYDEFIRMVKKTLK